MDVTGNCAVNVCYGPCIMYMCGMCETNNSGNNNSIAISPITIPQSCANNWLTLLKTWLL